MFRDTARMFGDKAVMPFSREWDRQESVDRKIVGQLGEVGTTPG